MRWAKTGGQYPTAVHKASAVITPRRWVTDRSRQQGIADSRRACSRPEGGFEYQVRVPGSRRLIPEKAPPGAGCRTQRTTSTEPGA